MESRWKGRSLKRSGGWAWGRGESGVCFPRSAAREGVITLHLTVQEPLTLTQERLSRTRRKPSRCRADEREVPSQSIKHISP